MLGYWEISVSSFYFPLTIESQITSPICRPRTCFATNQHDNLLNYRGLPPRLTRVIGLTPPPVKETASSVYRQVLLLVPYTSTLQHRVNYLRAHLQTANTWNIELKYETLEATRETERSWYNSSIVEVAWAVTAVADRWAMMAYNETVIQGLLRVHVYPATIALVYLSYSPVGVAESMRRGEPCSAVQTKSIRRMSWDELRCCSLQYVIMHCRCANS